MVAENLKLDLLGKNSHFFTASLSFLQLNFFVKLSPTHFKEPFRHLSARVQIVSIFIEVIFPTKEAEDPLQSRRTSLNWFTLHATIGTQKPVTL